MSAKRAHRKQAARERAEALRAQQEAAARKRRLRLAAATIAAVLAVLLLVVGVGLLTKDRTPALPADAGAPLDATSLAALNDVPAAAFDKAGASGITNGPTRVQDAEPVTKEGRPEILYVGAEYCPYCAGLRWSMATAMGRFGSWTALRESRSVQESTLDPVATVSFSQAGHGAAYTSDLVAFTGIETATSQVRNGSYTRLDRLEGHAKDLFEKYDRKPYTESEAAIPFVSIGGRTFQHGGIIDISLLEGKTTAQIAAALKNPDDPATRSILAGANVLTAAICEQTQGRPADVCGSTVVKDAASTIRDH